MSAKAECEALMNEVVPLAEQRLGDRGEFFPCGGAFGFDGEFILLAGYDGRERPSSDDLIQLTKAGLIEGAREGRYRATALVYDVRVVLPATGESSDAVAVALDHREGYSVTVLLPYRLDGGRLSFGSTFAQHGDADIFPLR